MKKTAIILSGLVMLLSACSIHHTATVQNPMLIGSWEQPNVTLDFDKSGHYHYLYKDGNYQNKQSGRYYAHGDSVVLYGFYPDAYTAESKNERWTIRKLTSDSLTVYAHKNIVVLNSDTLNTAGNETETYTRKKSIN